MWMQLKLKKIDPSYYANELEKEGAGCMLADAIIWASSPEDFERSLDEISAQSRSAAH